jgi:D-alanyl-D-alanine carboxypeptidase
MKRAFAFLLFAFTGLVAVLSAQDSTARPLPMIPPATQESLLAAVKKEMQAYGGKSSIPGAIVGVWMPGKQPWRVAYGLANISPEEKMTLDDKVRVGSNTKTFVVTVILQLVDEKKMSLDDPISKFDLGEKVPNAEKITVRELCQMRSGLPDAYHSPEFDAMNVNPQTKITVPEMIGFAAKQPVLFAPGTKWNYSNTNYLLLGQIIESVTHNSVADEISRRLLVPLKLHNTTYPVTDPGMPTPYAHGYGLNKDRGWEDNTVSYPPALTGAAGVMISDMEDMKVWVKDYVTGTTNSAATQKERLDCLPIGKPGLSFGLGIGCSGGWYGYTGGISGYNTGAYYLPSKDATMIVFVMSQQEKPDPGVTNSIVRDFAQILFPENVPFPGN